jgi:hypothetical protein
MVRSPRARTWSGLAISRIVTGYVTGYKISNRVATAVGRLHAPGQGSNSLRLGAAAVGGEGPDGRGEATDELDVQGILAFAERILPRASDLWVQASLDYKQRLQQLFFPEGIAYDGNRFNRTAATAPLFNYLAPPESADEKTVDQIGVSSNQLIIWLRKVNGLRRPSCCGLNGRQPCGVAELPRMGVCGWASKPGLPITAERKSPATPQPF